MNENNENIIKKLCASTTEFRTNEYVKPELYDWVRFVPVYACDTTSSNDTPRVGDGHREVITSKVMPQDFWFKAGKSDIIRYFIDPSFREGVRRVYELHPEEEEG